MVPAFYKRFTGARNALLKKTVERVKFAAGGKLVVLGLDWKPFERFAERSGAEVNKDLLSVIRKIFGFGPPLTFIYNNRSYGKRDMRRDVALAARHVHTKVPIRTRELKPNIRSTDASHWPEILDITSTLIKDVPRKTREAIAANEIAKRILRKKLDKLEKTIGITEAEIKRILTLPENGRPISRPPVIHTVVVSKR